MVKTSIILCAGAWHTRAHVEPVIPFFEKAGYRILPQTLLSAGAHSNLFQVDVKAVQSTTEAELRDGHNAVLILHSWAGMSGLEAVNNIAATTNDFNGKISRIILLGSFLDVEPIIENLFRNDFVVPEPENGISYTQYGTLAFYNDISPEKAQPFIQALTSQAFYIDQPQVTSDRWRSAAPLTYLLCEHDNCVPLEIGEKTATEYGMQLVRMDAGHCPYTSQPQKFAEVVDGILRA
jgi:pimeloyl-ACP methyl ester carboxylesterase